jgi:3-oxoacyl-[acyl-carrier protein] reductase
MSFYFAITFRIGNFAIVKCQDMGLLEGKVALITGGSRGIGKAVALKFASEGADIAFTCRTVSDSVQALVDELHGMGVKAKVYASDAASFEDAHKVVADVQETFGHIDILVNKETKMSPESHNCDIAIF